MLYESLATKIYQVYVIKKSVNIQSGVCNYKIFFCKKKYIIYNILYQYYYHL